MTITYHCPNCGRKTRKWLCEQCNQQASAEMHQVGTAVMSLVYGLRWVGLLLWWQLRAIVRELARHLFRFWQALKPVLIRERWGIFFLFGSFVALAVAMAWLTARG